MVFLILAILGTAIHDISGFSGDWGTDKTSYYLAILAGPSLLFSLLELPDFFSKSKPMARVRLLALLALTTGGLWVAMFFGAPFHAVFGTGFVALAGVLFFAQRLQDEVNIVGS